MDSQPNMQRQRWKISLLFPLFGLLLLSVWGCPGSDTESDEGESQTSTSKASKGQKKRRVVLKDKEGSNGAYTHIPRDAFGSVCAVSGQEGTGPVLVRKPGQPPRNDKEKREDLITSLVRKMLGELVEARGLRPESVPPVWIDEQVAGNVAEARVLTRDLPPFKKGQQFVAFSAENMVKHTKASKTTKTIFFIFAHEMAHLLNGHPLSRPGQHQHAKELEADYFAGFVMGQRGDALAEATAWIRASTPKEATETHPGRQDRINHTSEGWEAGCKRSGKCTKPADADAGAPAPDQSG